MNTTEQWRKRTGCHTDDPPIAVSIIVGLAIIGGWTILMAVAYCLMR